MSKAKFRVGDYVKKETLLYQDENESISNPEKRYKSEMRYYLILKVFEDNYGLQYRCQRFIDGVAENYTTTINAKLLEDGGEIVTHIDFSAIENGQKG